LDTNGAGASGGILAAVEFSTVGGRTTPLRSPLTIATVSTRGR
jgi:hypothetical protein